MLALEDNRWKSLHGGYRTPYDPTSALRNLYAGISTDSAWQELWGNLHHQRDVGPASYAVVPHLVEILKLDRCPDWNAYSLLVVIEIERLRTRNPPIPDWLLADYNMAWVSLLNIATQHLQAATDPLLCRSILGVIALCKGMHHTAEAIVFFDESEIEEFLNPGMSRSMEQRPSKI